MPEKHIPAVILGGSGYVAAEVLRLLLGHPAFRIEATVSQSLLGQRIDEVFPHLAGAAGSLTFVDMASAQEILHGKREVAVFAAMPHGETAPVIADLLKESGDTVSIVDMSADFRLRTPEAFEAVYKMPHPAPLLIPQFTCALPDLDSSIPERHIAHPGCFTTCVSLAAAPCIRLGLTEPQVMVSAVTGSTGAGRTPRPGTHHPTRSSAMWAYEPLRHRHTPEMEALTGAQVQFVPHSGPFSRGIHATCFLTLKQELSAEQAAAELAQFYEGSPFVHVSTRLPSVKEVVGSNRCHIGVAAQGRQLVLTSVIDNLVKGAAGGSIQWMNRMMGLEDSAGLMSPAPGWI